jgi:hypothetical protein
MIRVCGHSHIKVGLLLIRIGCTQVHARIADAVSHSLPLVPAVPDSNVVSYSLFLVQAVPDSNVVSYSLFLVPAVPDSNVVSYSLFLVQAVPDDEEGIKAWLQGRFGEATI